VSVTAEAECVLWWTAGDTWPPTRGSIEKPGYSAYPPRCFKMVGVRQNGPISVFPAKTATI
jgi:hypothetical protein